LTGWIQMRTQCIISVVIPFTGNPDFLEQAISSAIQQTFPHFEILLIDNLAKKDAVDCALFWVRKYPEKIRIVSEQKKGAAAARNCGIRESRGEFVAFLDSDDRMKPDRLSTQWELLRDNPEISLVGSWKDSISPDGKTVLEMDVKPQVPKWASILFRDDLRFSEDPLFEPQTSTFFFRKETSLRIGLFDENFDPFWLEDTDFVLRMYQQGQVSILSQSLIEYRTHSTQDELQRIYDFKNIENHGLFFEKLKRTYLDRRKSRVFEKFKKLSSRWLREAGTKIAWFSGGKNISEVLISRALKNDWSDIRNWEYPIRFLLPTSIWPTPFGKLPTKPLTLPPHINREWAENYLAF